MRKVFPGGTRGSGQSAIALDAMVPSDEDRQELELRLREKLEGFNNEYVAQFRDGFGMGHNAQTQSLYTKAATDVTLTRHLAKLSSGFTSPADPPQLIEYGCVFKLVPAGHADTADVPTLQAIPQGDYRPDKFESHDGDARIMCVPCMRNAFFYCTKTLDST